jgi:hypothetical protein
VLYSDGVMGGAASLVLSSCRAHWRRVQARTVTGFIIPAMAAEELASKELCLQI